MASFFDGLLGPAITQTANARTAYRSGQDQEKQQKIAEAVQLLALKRQQDRDAMTDRISSQRIQTLKSQGAAADALAQYRSTVPVQYLQDAASGEYNSVPRRLPLAGGARNAGAQPPSGGPPASDDTNAAGGSFSAPTVDDFARTLTGGAPRTAAGLPSTLPPGVLAALPRVNSPAADANSAGARPTGIVGPRKPAPSHPTTGVIDGRAVRGRVDPSGLFSADTTAEGDPVLARPPATPSARGATPDAQLNHSISNVRSQMAQTRADLTAATKQASVANSPFAQPAQRQAGIAAGARATALQRRLDSLTSVHDLLVAKQQGGAHVGTSPAAGVTPAGGAPAASAPTPSGPATGTPGLEPSAQRQMQQEFDAASADLQAVLQSAAPDAIKTQARSLYDQHMRDIAKRYNPHRS